MEFQEDDLAASKEYVGGISVLTACVSLIALPRTNLYDVATLDSAACSTPSRLPATGKSSCLRTCTAAT